MIIYRYEYPDGGGPFLTRDGVSRTHPEYQFDDNTLYGAVSIKALENWFKCCNIVLDPALQIVKYDAEVVHEYPDLGEIVVRKDTARKL